MHTHRMAWNKAALSRACKTFCSSRAQASKSCGQATIEAAFLVPTLMLVCAIVLQPLCLFYTRAVMESAAAEGLRALTTSIDSDAASHEACMNYILRRLDWVPPLAPFHVGGSTDWQIELEGNQASQEAKVSIRGHARPLPLMGAALVALLDHDDSGVVLSVEVCCKVRPAWLEGDYASWQSIW